MRLKPLAFLIPALLAGLVTAAHAQPVFINEIHYDNAGTDAGEAIEIAGPAGTDLSGWSLVLYNGNGGAPYATTTLSGVIPDQQNGFGTLSFAYPVNGIQNGSPDGIALVNGGTVVQFLSYEGVMSASGGPANGMTSTDIGVAEGTGTAVGDSLQLLGAGSVYEDFAWAAPQPNTFGAVNAGQSFGAVTPPPSSACGAPATAIHTIQGSGSASPLAGSQVEVEAIVVGDFQGGAQLSGFYLQQADGEVDNDPATSEGLFVYDGAGSVAVAPGDRVRVKGTVTEFGTAPNTLTELSSVTVVEVCSSGHAVTPAPVSLPVAGSGDWERVEGMAVRFTQTLTVTGNYTLGRYGEIDLAPARLMTPTNVVAPGAAAIALQAQNDLARLILDDANTTQNRDPVAWPEGGGLNADPLRTVRVGDRVNDGQPLDGVLDQRFGTYRLQPTGPVVFGAPDNPREATPAPLAGNLRAASFNVLNYFTTLDNGAAICGPDGGLDCRGADSATEFTRQRDKIVSALTAMDAHVVGLVELENNDIEPLADLVAGLNAATQPGRYAYIDTGTIGGDAIKVGIIFQPAAVTPVGSPAVLDSGVDVRAITTLNRPALAQTFERVGARADLQRFTVVVNHFKSKGSACAVPVNAGEIADPDTGDGQGNCNLTRTSMAHALADWLAGNPTGDPTPAASRKVLVLGDLNAYAKEDPVAALEAAGFSNQIARFVGMDAYSYQFAGQSGTLDHALANAAMARQVAGVTEWHINADEPVVFDYNLEFKSVGQQSSFYAPDAFRSSDHDPVIVGFNPLCGDLNDDGSVSAADQTALRAAFGQPAGSADVRMDYDGDGKISYGDYRVWYGCYRSFVQP